ncbi:MAG TPA: hypothetical protein VJR70_06600 [Stellaceae bacterium]|nr:hypothetical protein [Stellaceae bacterium]
MSITNRNRRFSRLATAGVAAIGLAAVAVPLAPAKAQLYFGIGPGGFDVGIGAPSYYNPYYRPYYRPYYGGYGYGYPGYYWGW